MFNCHHLPQGILIRVHRGNCCARCRTLWPTIGVLSPKVPAKNGKQCDFVCYYCPALEPEFYGIHLPFDRAQFLVQPQSCPMTSTRRASRANSFRANSFSLHAIMWFQDVPNSVPHHRNSLCAAPFPLKMTPHILAGERILRQSPLEMWSDCLFSSETSYHARNIYLQMQAWRLFRWCHRTNW